jgi:hypothetical protein
LRANHPSGEYKVTLRSNGIDLYAGVRPSLQYEK